MYFVDLLIAKKDAILDRWFRLILEEYSRDVSNFLKIEKDRFINPVGHTISRDIEILLDELVHGYRSEKMIGALDNIVRIRAVQDFTPSQALAFIFTLKKVVREELKVPNEGLAMEDSHILLEDLHQLENRIDGLAGLAFDVYVKCRDDINRIKVKEANAERAMAMRLMRMMKPSEKK